MNSLYNISYLLTNLFNTYVIYIFMNSFMKKARIAPKRGIILYTFFYFATSTVYLFFSIPMLNLTVMVLSLFAVTFAYDSKLSKKIISTVIIYAVSFISEAIVAGILKITNFSPFAKGQYGSIFSLVIVELITFSFVKILGHVFSSLDYELPGNGLFTVTAIAVPAISVFFGIQISMVDNISELTYCVSLLCLLALNFIIMYLYDTIAKSFSEKVQSEVSRQRELYYRNEAELISQSYKATRLLRHDIKNYGIALSHLIESGDKEKALEYISSFKNVIEPQKIFSKTGFVDIDSIINYKLGKSEQSGILITCKILMPNDFVLKTIDMVSMLGNLLDNATDAALKCENGYVDLHMEYDRGVLIIILKNSFDGTLNIQNGGLKTTKNANPTLHGIGLKSVQSSVEKYNGEMSISHTDNEFCAKVILMV